MFKIMTQICQYYAKLDIQTTWKNFNMRIFFIIILFFLFIFKSLFLI